VVPDLKRDSFYFRKAIMSRKGSRYITFNDKTQSLSDWSRETLIPLVALHHRLRRGWSVEEALTRPIKKHKRPCEGADFIALERKRDRDRKRRIRAQQRAQQSQ
jgi:hypothetical protein